MEHTNTVYSLYPAAMCKKEINPINEKAIREKHEKMRELQNRLMGDESTSANGPAILSFSSPGRVAANAWAVEPQECLPEATQASNSELALRESRNLQLASHPRAPP